MSILFALSTIPITLIVGMSLDYAEALKAREHLQMAVDAAASAGARLPATANANRQTQAEATFRANVISTSMGAVVPTINATNAEVSVEASYSSQTRIMNIIGVQSLEVTARTTARSQIQNGGVICLLALNRSSDNGLHLQGINKLSSDNCWAWVNSGNASAINAVGASAGSAQGFCSAGGVLGGEHFTPSPYTGCDPFEDPFKTRINNYSVANACDFSNVQFSSGSYTMQPGVYCGNTVIKPQAVVNMSPGLYVFRDGHLQVQAQGALKGDGVTLFFTHSNTRMEIRGGAEVELKAPATGDLAGFVIVDRKIDSYDSSIRETVIQGGGRLKIEGVVYAPQWKINISGNGELNEEAKFFTMIADSFYMEGNGKLFIRSDAESAGLPNIMPKIKNGPLLLN